MSPPYEYDFSRVDGSFFMKETHRTGNKKQMLIPLTPVQTPQNKAFLYDLDLGQPLAAIKAD